MAKEDKNAYNCFMRIFLSLELEDKNKEINELKTPKPTTPKKK